MTNPMKTARYSLSAILAEAAKLSAALDAIEYERGGTVADEPADQHYGDQPSPWAESEDATPTEPTPEPVEDTPEPTQPDPQPVKDETPAPVATPQTQPEPEPAAAPAPVVSLEQVRAKLADLSRAGHTEKVRQIIQDQGVAKLSEIPEEKFGAVLEAADRIAA